MQLSCKYMWLCFVRISFKLTFYWKPNIIPKNLSNDFIPCFKERFQCAIFHNCNMVKYLLRESLRMVSRAINRCLQSKGLLFRTDRRRISMQVGYEHLLTSFSVPGSTKHLHLIENKRSHIFTSTKMRHKPMLLVIADRIHPWTDANCIPNRDCFLLDWDFWHILASKVNMAFWAELWLCISNKREKEVWEKAEKNRLN